MNNPNENRALMQEPPARRRLAGRTARSVVFLPLLLWLVAAVASGCAAHGQRYVRPSTQSASAPPANGLPVRTRLLLIGDAGFPNPNGEPVLEALRHRAGERPDVTTVLFLGDNIYEQGMPPPADRRRAAAERRLDDQIDVCLGSGARGIFLPGNHDWAEEGSDGWSSVKRQTVYIDERDRAAAAAEAQPGRPPFIQMLPADGDPMPCVIDADGHRLILLDTQWFLHGGPKPDVDEDAVLDALQALILSAGDDQLVIVCGHHPLRTHGPHSGEFSLTEYAFAPTVVARWAGISKQDLMHPAYDRLAESLTEAMASGKRRPLVYASGHEHNLQVLSLDRGPLYQLVSGAGTESKLQSVGHGDDTIFSWSRAGFMEIDLLEDGRAILRVLVAGLDDEPEIAFAMWIGGPEADL